MRLTNAQKAIVLNILNEKEDEVFQRLVNARDENNTRAEYIHGRYNKDLNDIINLIKNTPTIEESHELLDNLFNIQSVMEKKLSECNDFKSKIRNNNK